jgi:D-glycero-alpha-D-manno-heptose 1-phosphate guanylyltransferase
LETVVLAGGFGTRLRAVVPDLPKPMAPVAGRPFLEILLSMLAAKGVRRAVLSLGYRAEVIQAHFGRRFAGIELVSEVETEPLGTGGALRAALARCEGDAALVVNGDTFLDLELPALQARWAAGGRPLIVGRAVDDTARFGRLDVEGARLLGFAARGAGGPGVINMGHYVLPTTLFDGVELPKSFSFEADFLAPRARGLGFEVFVTEGLFIDIGVPEDYARAQAELAPWGLTPALFLDRDGVINVDRGYVHRIEDFEFVDGIFELAGAAKARGLKVVVVTNQAGIGRGLYTEAQFHALTDWMKQRFADEGAALDGVYFCPTHPTAGVGAYRVDSPMRKPGPGMLLQAARELGIDLAQSAIVGDHASDMAAGAAAGLQKLLLLDPAGRVTQGLPRGTRRVASLQEAITACT